MNSLHEYITVDNQVLGGTPVFKNTRIAVQTLFDYLEDESLQPAGKFYGGQLTVKNEYIKKPLRITKVFFYD